MNVRLLKSVLCVTTAIGLCHAVTAHAADQASTPATTDIAPVQLAQAQSAKSDADSTKGVEEVVVTGTLIRGVAPAGANVIGMSAEEIQAAGVVDANRLLGQLPQSNFFLNLPRPGVIGGNAGTVRVPITPPDVRGLRIAGIPSGSPTLVLLDNHRVVPAGLEQSTVDAGVIPPGMLEREEIVLDGTSAIYGTDAVGGVINYIPKKRFKGGEVDATYGLGIKGYYETTANVSNGWTWDGGGLGLTYSFGKNNDIRNRDRPEYALPRNWYEGQHPTQQTCPGAPIIGNGASIPTNLATTAYVMNGPTSFRVRTASDFCDTGYNDLQPALNRHSGFMDFSQDVTDRLKFDMTGFYSYRMENENDGPLSTTLQIRPNNPYYLPLRDSNGNLLPGTTVGGPESVGINLAPVEGYKFSYQKTSTELGQVTPSLTYDVGGDWQVKADFTWGKSNVTTTGRLLDTDALTNYICGVATAPGQACAARGGAMTVNNAIDPYNLLATTNTALFGQLDYLDIRDAQQELYQFLVKADGTLFTIPGGKVKAAFGVDWNKETMQKEVTDGVTHLMDPRLYSSVNEKAVFGELNVPIVGPGNRMTGIESLSLDVSGRYDTYATYGDTFNPKIAATYEPVDWITLRGNWGTSFRAPNATDKLAGSFNTLFCVGGSGVLGGCTSNVQVPPSPIYTGSAAAIGTAPNVYLTLMGTVPGVKPETSHNWTIGGDIRPPIVDGLTLSGSYYVVDYRNEVNIPNPAVSLTQMFLYAPTTYLMCINPDGSYINGGTGCSRPQLNTFAAATGSQGQGVLNQVLGAGYKVQYIIDTRTQNLYRVNIHGLDVAAKYVHPTSWGSIFASWHGNFQLKNDFQPFAAAPVQHTLAFGGPTVHMTMTVGATYHDFSASATLQHENGFLLDPSTFTATTTPIPGYASVDQFDVLNMSFRWNVNGNRILTQDLQLTLNVNNVFDTNPPVVRTASSSVAASGFGLATQGTVGRLIEFGISKKF